MVDPSQLLVGVDFSKKTKKALLREKDDVSDVVQSSLVSSSSEDGGENSDDEIGVVGDAEDLSTEEKEAAFKARVEELEEYRLKKTIQVWGSDVPAPVRTIKELKPYFKKYYKQLEANLMDHNIATLTPVQQQVFPALFAGRELVISAPTGCGKTAAFLLPLFAHLLADPGKDNPGGIRALVLVPTLELSNQILDVALWLSDKLPISVGNSSSELMDLALKDSKYIETLKYSLYISTPMSLIKLVRNKAISLPDLEWLVVDEADRLFETEFLDQLDEILASASTAGGARSTSYQNGKGMSIKRILLSATISVEMEELAFTFMVDPISILVGQRETAVSSVRQELVYTGREDGKFLALRHLIRAGSLTPPCIIFIQDKNRAFELFRELIAMYNNTTSGNISNTTSSNNNNPTGGLYIDILHSGRKENERRQVIANFKAGKVWTIICTDILARGLDITGVKLVINYDLPTTAAAYVHRVGRSGRAGATGAAVTFFTDDDKYLLRTIAPVVFRSGGKAPEWLRTIDGEDNNNTAHKRKQSENSDTFNDTKNIEGDRKRRIFMVSRDAVNTAPNHLRRDKVPLARSVLSKTRVVETRRTNNNNTSNTKASRKVIDNGGK